MDVPDYCSRWRSPACRCLFHILLDSGHCHSTSCKRTTIPILIDMLSTRSVCRLLLVLLLLLPLMLLLMLMLFNAVDAGVDGATAMVLLSLLPLFHVPEACCGQVISLAKIPKEKAFRVSMWKHDNMMGSLPHFGRCTSDSIISIITTVKFVITIMNHDRYYYHYSHH